MDSADRRVSWREIGLSAMLLVACVTVLATLASAQSFDESARRIIAEERMAANTPAMSAILMRDGAVLARVTDGLADPDAGIPVEIETAFPAGSLTKILTAAVVMTEVDAGRLDLDAPIAGYVPTEWHPVDADGVAVDVTLRQLLSHSAGLPVTWDGFPPNPPVESREAYIAESREIVRPPGTRLVYSNAAFVLAGEIAAASASMRFENLAQLRLFDPLGMTRSSLGSPAAYDAPLAAGHARGRGGTVQAAPHLDLTTMAAAGSLLTTPDDLARFATMLLDDGIFQNRRILSAEAVEEMMQLQARAHPALEEGFGLGLGVRRRDGRHVAWWDGTTTAAAAHFALLPEADTAVIVMANLADNHPTSVSGRRLLALATSGQSDPAVAETTSSTQKWTVEDGYYVPVDFVDPEQWFFAYAMPFRVQADDGRITVTSRIMDTMTLMPIALNRARVEGGMLDNATALLDGRRLQIGFVRTQRLPPLLTPPALLTYAGLLALAILSISGLGLRALWRRLRGPVRSR